MQRSIPHCFDSSHVASNSGTRASSLPHLIMTSVPQPPSPGAAPGPSSAVYGIHDLRDHDAAASEETPLLMSSASSISSRTYSLYSPNTTTTTGHVEDADPTKVRPPIPPARALAITFSLGLLIFLQGTKKPLTAIGASSPPYEVAHDRSR